MGAAVKAEGIDHASAHVVNLLDRHGMREHPKGLACLKAMYTREQPVILGGGSGGGGKSHTLRVAAVHFALWLAKHGFRKEKLFFGTLDYPALRDRHIDRFISDFGDHGRVASDEKFGLHWKWNDPNIPVICFRNLDDPNKRKGSEFAAGFIDETTELLRKIFGAVLYMCRKPGLPHNPVLTMSNPDGVGYQWCKEAWRPHLGGSPPDGASWEEVLAWALARAAEMPPYTERFDPSGEMRAADYIYIPFKPEDNPTFDEARWWRGVAHLEAHIQRARRLGLWETPEGARWPKLDPNRTLFKASSVWRNGVPRNMYRIVSCDWGKRDPFCALYTIEDFEGHLWTYREIYSKGLSDEAQMRLIMQRLAPDETVQRFVGDPQYGHTQTNYSNNELLPSHQETYNRVLKEAGDKRFGSGLELAPRAERLQRLATLDSYLDYDNGHPDWHIEESCGALWGELTGAIYATGTPVKERSEDIDERCPDHAITASYYGFHARLTRPRDERPEVDAAKAVATMQEERRKMAEREMRQTVRRMK